MNMKFASLFLATGILSNMASSAPQKRLRDTNKEIESSMDHRSLAKSGKTSKGSKGKGSTGGGANCEQDDFLVARYGEQLCPDQVKEKFTKIENGDIQTTGLQNFLQPDFSVPVIDTFGTLGGQVALTLEQAESICITMCEHNINCGAVSVEENVNPPGRTCGSYTGKPYYQCIMVNPELGPGVYLSDVPEEILEVQEKQLSTFLKKSSPPLPSFDLIKCNVDGTSANLQAAIGCQFQQITNPEICDPLLTEDWNTFMAPAFTCLVINGGEDSLNDCFVCLSSAQFSKVEEVCPTDADDDTNIIRDPSKCGEVCIPDKCERELSKALLCVAGSPLVFDSDLNTGFGGYVNSGPHFEAFTCPPVE